MTIVLGAVAIEGRALTALRRAGLVRSLRIGRSCRVLRPRLRHQQVLAWHLELYVYRAHILTLNDILLATLRDLVRSFIQ